MKLIVSSKIEQQQMFVVLGNLCLILISTMHLRPFISIVQSTIIRSDQPAEHQMLILRTLLISIYSLAYNKMNLICISISTMTHARVHRVRYGFVELYFGIQGKYKLRLSEKY